VPVNIDPTDQDTRTPTSAPPFPYNWLTPEDAVRHALAAFYQACRYIDHVHREDPHGRVSRNEWFDHVLAILEARVLTEATQRRVQGMSSHYANQAKNTLEGYTEPGWLEAEYSDRESTGDIHCRGSQNESTR